MNLSDNVASGEGMECTALSPAFPLPLPWKHCSLVICLNKQRWGGFSMQAHVLGECNHPVLEAAGLQCLQKC